MRLAVQLYTLRAKLAEDVPSTLRALAEAGAEEVELAGLYDRTAAELRGLLDDAGLKACSMHVALDRFDAFDAVADEARTLGIDTVIVPSVPKPGSDAEADAVVARIVAARDTARDGGFAFAYHNHAFEFGEVDLWRRLVATDLDLELDVGWLRIAGHDPLADLEALSGRVRLVHAKDVKRTGDGWIDVVAGDGELDFAAIAKASADAGASHLIVELDTPSDDPVDDARRSLATLREAIA